MNRQNSQIVSVWVCSLVILMTAGFLATIPGQKTPVALSDQSPSGTQTLPAKDNASESTDTVLVIEGDLEYVAMVYRPQAAVSAKPAAFRGQI